MISFILAALGRAEKLEAMRRGFTSKNEPEAGTWSGLISVALVGVVAIAVLLILNRVQQGKKWRDKGGVHGLFRDVLRTLSLSFSDRRLLRRLASEMALENPTAMLLTPQLYAEAVYGYVATKRGSAGSVMTRLEAVCRQIFNQELPPPPSAETLDAAIDTPPPGKPRRATKAS